MRRLFVIPVLVAILASAAGKVANAAYCGAISYQDCEGSVVSCCEVPACHTVMKNVRRVVHEQETVQATRTEYQTVYEDRQVNAVRYERETQFRPLQCLPRASSFASPCSSNGFHDTAFDDWRLPTQQT